MRNWCSIRIGIKVLLALDVAVVLGAQPRFTARVAGITVCPRADERQPGDDTT